jgi:hypothetical protein
MRLTCSSATVGRMQSEDLTVTDGAVAGSWIKPRLGGEFGAVTLQVPGDFDAYARVFHPAFDRQRHPVSWAQVARVRETTPHREMQWHSILGLRNADELRGSYYPHDGSGVKWMGSDPPIGTMDIETLDALCEVLANHSADVTRCFFGLCTIHGWLDSLSAGGKLPPLLELPFDRNHIVLTGPLSAVDQIVDNWFTDASIQIESVGKHNQDLPAPLNPSQPLQREAPNLIWPADESWFVVTDVDFDSTLVGGDTALIDAIVKSPNLEAWHVRPTDSLADNADKVNAINDPAL